MKDNGVSQHSLLMVNLKKAAVTIH